MFKFTPLFILLILLASLPVKAVNQAAFVLPCLFSEGELSVIGSNHIDSNCGLHSNSFVEFKGNSTIAAPFVSMPNVDDVVVKGQIQGLEPLLRNGMFRSLSVDIPVYGACDYEDVEIYTQTTLDPGVYCGGLSIFSADVTLNPGVYFIVDGDLKVRGDSSVTSSPSEVRIYLTGSQPNSVGDISLIGDIDVNLPGAVGGEALIAQDILASSSNGNKATNEINVANFDFDGLIYIPNRGLNLKSQNSGQIQGCFTLYSQSISIIGHTNIVLDQNDDCDSSLLRLYQ